MIVFGTTKKSFQLQNIIRSLLHCSLNNSVVSFVRCRALLTFNGEPQSWQKQFLPAYAPITRVHTKVPTKVAFLCVHPLQRFPLECSRKCARKCTHEGLVVVHLVCVHLLCSLPILVRKKCSPPKGSPELSEELGIEVGKTHVWEHHSSEELL